MSEANGEYLPAGWALPPLADVAQVNPPLDRCVLNDGTQVTFVPMRAVQAEGGGLTAPEIRPYGEVKKGYTSFLSADVIMAKITPCMENGKTTVVPDVPGQVCFGSTEFHVVRPEVGVSPRWVEQFLLQHETRRDAQRQMAGGVGQMRVPAAFLQNVQIPLAPTPEQDRITDVLDELFSNLATGMAALERGAEKLKLYRASVLKAAVEGALTADWRQRPPAAEPASELLKRILAERRRRWEEDQLRKFAEKGKTPPKNWKAKYNEPVAPDTTALPTLPEGWCWVTVHQLAAPEHNSITDGPFGSNLKTEHYTNSGPRVIRLQNIKDGVFADGKAHISEERFKLLEKHQVFAGDIVIAALGDSPPRSCLVPQSLGPAIVKADCIRFSPSKMIIGPCINFFLNSPPTRMKTKEVVHGVGRPRLNLDAIRSIALPLPSAAEQEAIVEALEDQFSVIDHLEADLDGKLKAAQALRQSILHHAFTGQLVPQDPNDESASQLLKRIAAEREARNREAAFAKGGARKGNGAGRRGRPRKRKERVG